MKFFTLPCLWNWALFLPSCTSTHTHQKREGDRLISEPPPQIIENKQLNINSPGCSHKFILLRRLHLIINAFRKEGRGSGEGRRARREGSGGGSAGGREEGGSGGGSAGIYIFLRGVLRRVLGGGFFLNQGRENVRNLKYIGGGVYKLGGV